MIATEDLDMTTNASWEINCYGMTEQEIESQIVNSTVAKLSGVWMCAMSILSDAQHMLEMDDKEQARKYINVAKYIIAEKLKDTK